MLSRSGVHAPLIWRQLPGIVSSKHETAKSEPKTHWSAILQSLFASVQPLQLAICTLQVHHVAVYVSDLGCARGQHRMDTVRPQEFRELTEYTTDCVTLQKQRVTSPLQLHQPVVPRALNAIAVASIAQESMIRIHVARMRPLRGDDRNSNTC
jgi:hypothetical protein